MSEAKPPSGRLRSILSKIVGGAAMPAEHGESIEELRSVELEGQAEKLAAAGLFGLSLSGGGIRSATFSLGVLQGLHRLGILQCFDYLSTVSGGGYMGGFWSAWLKRGGPGVFPARRGATEEPPPIRHLREFSNFLSPRLGLFSYDTGRLVVAALSAAVPSFLVALSVLIVALALWSGLAALLLAAGAGVSLVVFLGAFLLAALLFEAAWQARDDGRLAHGGLDAFYLLLVVLVAAGLGWAWAFLRPGTSAAYFAGEWLPLYDERSAAGFRTLLLPAAGYGVVLGVLVVFRALGSKWANSPKRLTWRASLDRLLARLLFLVAAWLVLATLWQGTVVFGLPAELVGGERVGYFSALLTTLTGVFIWLRKLVERQPNKPTGTSLLERLKPRVPMLVAYAVVTLLVVAMIATLLYWSAQGPWQLLDGITFPPHVGLIVIAVLVLGLAGRFFHPNRIGLHSFYRGRLARAYLGATNPRTRGKKVAEEMAGDDFELRDLRGQRPVHLVCCAANDLTPSEPLTALNRGAVSAVLSPYGFSVDGYWKLWGTQSSPSIGAAVTASGAAFNSMMGGFSIRLGLAAGFLMSALNLRLGMWLRHPGDREGRPSKEWDWPGWLFLKELFGISSAHSGDVHLSDGGHFENMAVYELIRRRCRFILAVDCGADPSFAFDDVANLVRRAREDFGVEVRIDVTPLRPRSDGPALQPMVAGDIHYPGGTTGTLLLIKPTLIGSEPADVQQYATRNSRFPAESTGDQFYDEAQWESYRRLGEFAADTAFAFAFAHDRLRPKDPDTPCTEQVPEGRPRMLPPKARARAIFSHARFAWQPKPPRLEERVARFAARAAELDQAVSACHDGKLVRQVYKEIGEAEGDAGVPRREPLNAEELTGSLSIVRRALLFLEEVYYAWDLESTYNQPLSLGIANYFARWTYAPVVRMWWPIVRSTLTPGFARFMEARFELKGIQPSGHDGGPEDVVAAVTDEHPPGFAMRCWEVGERARHLPPGDLLAYRLRMKFEGEYVFSIQAALLRYHRKEGGTIAWWDARDFFVPPGLWGMGIGEDFLDRLVHERPRELSQASAYIVRILQGDSSDTTAQKGAADLAQLYRSAGFRDVPFSEPYEVRLNEAGGVLRMAELAKPLGDPDRPAIWLVRPLP